MKKDGKELFDLGKYKIYDCDVKKTIWGLQNDDGTKEYYIKTTVNGFERVWRRSGTYALTSVMDDLKSVPQRIMKEAANVREWYEQTESSRDEYKTEKEWSMDMRAVSNYADGFVTALHLSDCINASAKWALFGYMLGRSD